MSLIKHVDLSIPFEMIVREPSGAFVGQLCQNVLTEEMKKILLDSTKKLFNNIAKRKKINSRGKAVQLHCGYWGKHTQTKQVYKTKDSRDLAWMVFHTETQTIWEKISNVIEQILPLEYERLQKIKRYWRFPFTWGLWHVLAYNIKLASEIHKDKFDYKDGICIIIPVGDFEGGDITINEFKLNFKCLFGDIFVLSSARYFHQNQEILRGYRNSIVLFNTCECAKVVPNLH